MDQRTESARLYQEGRTLLESGDTRDGIAKLEASVSLCPHFKTLEILGESLLTKGEAGQAAVYLAASALLGTNAAKSFYLLAKAFIDLNDFAEARTHLLRALRINPNYAA